MANEEFCIRPIVKDDNPAVASIIRSVMTEYGATGSGFAIHDPEVERMCEAFADARSRFLVIEHSGSLIGCAGVTQLKGADSTVCEIQKMYFLPAARGKGLGEKVLRELLAFAQSVGFTLCYLETTGTMKEAHRLYEKVGFTRRSSPLGCTGHHACEIWYEVTLDSKFGTR